MTRTKEREMEMRIIDEIIERVGWDKLLHFVAGFAITCCVALAGVDKLGMTSWQGAVCGFFAASLVGLAKELLDESFDWKDLAATALGGLAVLIGAAVSLLV